MIGLEDLSSIANLQEIITPALKTYLATEFKGILDDEAAQNSYMHNHINKNKTGRNVDEAIHVVKDADNIVYYIDIPGSQKETLDIQLSENHITISAKRECGVSKEYKYTKEIPIGYKIDKPAEYHDGVLNIYFTKATSASTRINVI